MTDSVESLTKEEKILVINPLVLYFPPPLNRIITNILKLQNTSKDYYVSYKVKTTRPNRYCVRPNLGLIPPGESIELQIHYSFQKDPPTSLRSKDKFQVESILLTAPLGPEQSLSDLFKTTPKEKIMKEKLKCRFASPTPTVSDRVVKERGQESSKESDIKSDTMLKDPPIKESKASVETKGLMQELALLKKERDALKKELRDMHSSGTASFVPVLTGNNLVALLLAVLMGYCLGAMQLFSMAIIVSAIVVILIVGKFIGPKGK